MIIMIPFANGFEELEAIANVDILRRADIDVITVSLENETVKGAHDIEIITDMNIDNVNTEDLAGIILPGGMPGAAKLRDSKKVIDIVKKLDEEGKLVAAICAAPIVLEKAGIITNKKVTSYPGFEEELASCNYISDRVVRDNNIITARGPGVALDFAISIVEYLRNSEISKQIKAEMLA